MPGDGTRYVLYAMLDNQETDVFRQRCTVTLFGADVHLNYWVACMPCDCTRGVLFASLSRGSCNTCLCC